MDNLKFVSVSDGAPSCGKWMRFATAGFSLLLAIAGCSSESGDPTMSDVVAVGGASPRNEFVVSADKARAANRGPLDASVVAHGGQAIPRPQANPNATPTRVVANPADLQRTSSPIQTPKLPALTNVLDLPSGGSFGTPVTIMASSASSSYDGRWPTSAS